MFTLPLWVPGALKFVKDNGRLFALVGLVLASVIASWVVYGWRVDAQKLDALQAQVNDFVKKQEAAEKLSAELEKTLAGYKARNRKLNESLDNELQKSNAAYAECVLTVDGLLLVNQRLEGRATGKHD